MPDDSSDDWRLQGQEKHLSGVQLAWRTYRVRRPDWDHDHCEFCSIKFAVANAPETVHEGYCTLDEYHWICPACFEDFRERFRWKLRDKKPDA